MATDDRRFSLITARRPAHELVAVRLILPAVDRVAVKNVHAVSCPVATAVMIAHLAGDNDTWRLDPRPRREYFRDRFEEHREEHPQSDEQEDREKARDQPNALYRRRTLRDGLFLFVSSGFASGAPSEIYAPGADGHKDQ